MYIIIAYYGDQPHLVHTKIATPVAFYIAPQVCSPVLRVRPDFFWFPDSKMHVCLQYFSMPLLKVNYKICIL